MKRRIDSDDLPPSLSKKSSSYIAFNNNSPYTQYQRPHSTDPNSGWKVHLAIPSAHLPKLWEELYAILTDKDTGFDCFKALRPDHPVQPGKAVVIFFSETEMKKPSDIEGKLLQIETFLAEKKIESEAYQVLGDEAVPNSTFCFYTFDNSQMGGKFYRCASIQRTLKIPHGNIFETMDLKHAPTWERAKTEPLFLEIEEEPCQAKRTRTASEDENTPPFASVLRRSKTLPNLREADRSFIVRFASAGNLGKNR